MLSFTRSNREVKLDVYGKRQTAKIKLLPSVFSSLYSGIKIFVFAVNSKRHFSETGQDGGRLGRAQGAPCLVLPV